MSKDRCPHWDCGWCYLPTDDPCYVEGTGGCVGYDSCEWWKANTKPKPKAQKKRNKYVRRIYSRIDKEQDGTAKSILVDVYDVLAAFDVTCQANGHALKKQLAPGLRGSKGELQDLREAAGSLAAAIEMLEQMEDK